MSFTTVADFVDATLKAKEPVNVYSLPENEGVLIKTVQPKSIVGEIYSWVTRDGKTYWKLKGGGYVEHKKGRFDPIVAENTSSKKQIDLTKDGNLSLPGFGFLNTKNLKLVGIGIGALLLILVLSNVSNVVKAFK